MGEQSRESTDMPGVQESVLERNEKEQKEGIT
jgi:hypothetical protein